MHDLEIGPQQIVAAHAGLARKPRCHDHDVGIGRIVVIVRPLHFDVITFNGARFQQVEAFTLRHPLQNVDHHHVGQLFVDDAVRERCAHVSCPDYRHFFAHKTPL